MAINFIDIPLHDSTPLSEYKVLNLYMLTGWTIIGHSTFTSVHRYGEMDEFVGTPDVWERYTLFKPDHTIGEIALDTPATPAPEAPVTETPGERVASGKMADTLAQLTAIYAEHGLPDFAAFNDGESLNTTPPQPDSTQAGDSGAYYVELRDGFYEAYRPNGGGVIDGSSDKMYIEGVVDNLNTETTALRAQLTSAQETIARLEAEVKAVEYSAKQALFWLNRAYKKSGNDTPTHEDIVEARGHLESIVETDTD